MEEKDYSDLTKHQKRTLKKEGREREKEMERAEMLKKHRIRKIKTYGTVILIILVVIGFFYWKSIPPKDAPIIEITPESYNFGTVSQAKGTVSAEMTITNKGLSDLIINKMDSSCGCTSASVVYNGIEGPRFSMSSHGTNPKNWKQVIPPGETAQLKIYYNPNVHKEMRGAFTRSIMIYSNAARNKIKEIKVSGVQID